MQKLRFLLQILVSKNKALLTLVTEFLICGDSHWVLFKQQLTYITSIYILTSLEDIFLNQIPVWQEENLSYLFLNTQEIQESAVTWEEWL